jgi:hypothetical protein
MAGGTTTSNASVVECSCLKANGAFVAKLARLGCHKVSAILTQGLSAVVAGGTTRGDATVVHRGARSPSRKIRRRVAKFARLACRDVFRVRRLAGRGNAVVARRAIGSNAGMGERCRFPRLGRMAGLAGLGCRDVVRFLTRRRSTVVARRAVCCDANMVELRRHPGFDCVARFTRLRRRDMVGLFPGCLRAIMTGTATCSHPRVIKPSRLPASRRVATLAIICTGNVPRRLPGLNLAVVA